MLRIPIVLAALLLTAPAMAADTPFSDLGFDPAAVQAKEAGKLLMIDFTATWCPPCKMMEKQTWPDEAVRAWIAEHAVAIQVDIDKEQNLAQRFSIQAIPTLVFLRDGEELDRHTGFRSAKDFVAWGDSIIAGKSEASEDASQAKELLASDDVDKRYKAAREALDRGEYDVALQHFVWLWPNTREATGYRGVRLSFMVVDMARLASKHEPARVAFQQIIDNLQKKVDEAALPTADDWQEWTALCEYFGERERVVAWYEARRDAEGRLFGGDSAPDVQGMVIEDVFAALLEAGRPVDAVRLYRDLPARVREITADCKRSLHMTDEIPEEMRAQMRAHQERTCRETVATIYAAALADGRTEQAAAVASELLATLDDAESRMSLVESTLKVAPVRPPELAAWLDEAAAQGADVTELRARLAAPK